MCRTLDAPLKPFLSDQVVGSGILIRALMASSIRPCFSLVQLNSRIGESSNALPTALARNAESEPGCRNPQSLHQP
jgi:hypothetical protein